jgi:hypothetical protein
MLISPSLARLEVIVRSATHFGRGFANNTTEIT